MSTDLPVLAEFELIDRIRSRLAHRDDVVLGIGDDGAIVQPPAGQQLVIAMDTLNSGVHFPHATPVDAIGWKALAVNLSDLAAMGAQPAWCTLSLSLPQADAAWMDAFLDGFLALARMHDVALIGGDTTRGPLSISVAVHGFVRRDAALRRAAARPGDEVWVSGTLGDAAGALALLGATPLEPAASAPTGDAATLGELQVRLDRPTPRVALGRELAALAHACIDVSDGLLADLAHIACASAVAIEIELSALPASDALRATFDSERVSELQATGGDDYELCFTAPAANAERIAQLAASCDVRLTRIGRVEAGAGVRAVDAAGRVWEPARTGYAHFA
ncbi:thiamine-phosphate kinase [Lysobacter korlensis]|uniref:Thiamine-monophosphate kinase n=1 Tax=Lysobacter korlensis TaxID=553636 RepID=A0ABV6RIY7_9GAMM